MREMGTLWCRICCSDCAVMLHTTIQAIFNPPIFTAALHCEADHQDLTVLVVEVKVRSSSDNSYLIVLRLSEMRWLQVGTGATNN